MVVAGNLWVRVGKLITLVKLSGFNLLPFLMIFKLFMLKPSCRRVQYMQAYVLHILVTKNCKHLGSHNALKQKHLLDYFFFLECLMMT